MNYQALAIDYDGTLAHGGVVDSETINMLVRARSAGVHLIMVTGRELTILFNTFDQVSLFDRIVAENGAVIFDPSTKHSETIAIAPPPALLQRLTQQRVPFSVGHSIVATVEPYEHVVLAAIRDRGVEWHVIFNKGSVMVLPANVTKATGLSAALAGLSIAPERVVGIGDAENDQAFLRYCGRAVAVANALPAVKAIAHLVTAGAHGKGVVELIERLLADDLDEYGSRENISFVPERLPGS